MGARDTTCDLYVSGTAHGQKAALMLEECGLPYRHHFVDLMKREHQTPEYLALNPEGKTPVLVDPDGPGGKIVLSQSLAIVAYLAEKTGRFMPTAASERAEAFRYMAIVASDIAGAFSGLYMFARSFGQPDSEAAAYFTRQAHRHLKVMEARLSQSRHLAGEDHSLADILACPVAYTSMKLLPDHLEGYPNIARWAEMLAKRPAVRKVFKLDEVASSA